MTNAPLNTFIIYSSRDRALRDEFLRHLRPLVRAGKLRVWSDNEIPVGEAWNAEISENLEITDLFIPLASVNFFDSDTPQHRQNNQLRKNQNLQNYPNHPRSRPKKRLRDGVIKGENFQKTIKWIIRGAVISFKIKKAQIVENQQFGLSFLNQIPNQRRGHFTFKRRFSGW